MSSIDDQNAMMPTDDDDAFAERIARPLRRAEPVMASLEQRVMASVTPELRLSSDLPRRPASRSWLVTPRLSPVAAFAMAASVALVVGLAVRRAPDAPAGARATAVAATQQRPVDTVRVVHFVFVAPNAASVTLVGDFNDWNTQATPLQAAHAGNVWTVTVPLAVGRHQYAFVVDGTRWMTDPSAPTAVEDDFGTPNSVVTVGEVST